MCLEIDRFDKNCKGQKLIINNEASFIVCQDFIQLVRKVKVYIENVTDQWKNTVIFHENCPRVIVRKLNPQKLTN